MRVSATAFANVVQSVACSLDLSFTLWLTLPGPLKAWRMKRPTSVFEQVGQGSLS